MTVSVDVALRLLREGHTRALSEAECQQIREAAHLGGDNAQMIRRGLDEALLTRSVTKLGRELASPVDGGSGGSAYSAIMAAGWQLGGPAVSIPFGAVLIDNAGDAAPLREPGIVRQGIDQRRLYPALEQVPLNGATRVDELVANARSLADPGDMQLAIDAVTEKPTTSSGATLENFDVKMVASVSDPYANAIVSLPAFRDLVGQDMTIAYQDSLDDLVVNTLTDNAGTTDDDGADLFEKLRKAVTAIQAEGFNPTLAAVSPEDAETLDLTRAGSGGDPTEGPFLLTPSPRSSSFTPLWSLTLRIVKNLTSPIVLDPTAVRLYLDNVRFDADPFTGFSTNETRFRYEGPAIPVLRQPAGVYVVAAS